MKNCIEEIIRESYQDYIVKKSYDPEKIIPGVYDELLSILGIEKDDLKELLSDCSFDSDLGILRHIIFKKLPENEIWKDIIEPRWIILYTPHGDYKEIFLRSKEEQLRNIDQVWIYKNYGLVSDFMNPENEDYKKLEKIKNVLRIRI